MTYVALYREKDKVPTLPRMVLIKAGGGCGLGLLLHAWASRRVGPRPAAECFWA